MNYALIENGVVTNIIWLHPGNENDFPGCVACGELPVAVGDCFVDGVFYRDGERVLTPAEMAYRELAQAQAAYMEGVQEA